MAVAIRNSDGEGSTLSLHSVAAIAMAASIVNHGICTFWPT